MQSRVIDGMQKLYLKAKVYELFCLYFDTNTPDLEQCPYLENEDQVSKIRKPKPYF